MNQYCIRCTVEIPVLRLEALPGVKTCINCSTETPKRGRIITLGEGDHTYNELEILDQETYTAVTKLELGRGISNTETYLELQDLEHPEFGDSLNDLKIPYSDKVKENEQEEEWEEFFEEEE